MNAPYTAATVEQAPDVDSVDESAALMDPPAYIYKSKLTGFVDLAATFDCPQRYDRSRCRDHKRIHDRRSAKRRRRRIDHVFVVLAIAVTASSRAHMDQEKGLASS